MAIEHALSILQWYENLPKEDMPPEHIWEDPEGLEQWWKDVEARRDDGISTERGRGRKSDDDSDDRPDGNQDPSMVENDLARYLKNG